MDLGSQRGSKRELLNETVRERRVRRAKAAMPTLSAAVSGPLAGVTVLFIGSMAALPKGSIDDQLGIALTCFAVALPLLLLAFLFAMSRTGGWLATFAALMPGLIFELVGITAILSRLSTLATIAFGVTVGICVLGFLGVFFAVAGRDRESIAAWHDAYKGTPKEKGKV